MTAHLLVCINNGRYILLLALSDDAMHSADSFHIQFHVMPLLLTLFSLLRERQGKARPGRKGKEILITNSASVC